AMAASGYDPGFHPPADPSEARLGGLMPESSGVGLLWLEFGAAFGLEVGDPTADKRVVTFCLGLPEDQFMRHGEDRRLIRRAMAEVLPPEVVWNNRRGKQAADLPDRMHVSLGEIEETVATLQRSHRAPFYLDMPRLRANLDRLRRNPTGVRII
ncbi:MAG: asparagine synthetase B, partial [Deltaproteobacteria bacterium]|nr:asparagine synthetase B [Deltaproteobacteria bacterium]